MLADPEEEDDELDPWYEQEGPLDPIGEAEERWDELETAIVNNLKQETIE